MAEMIRKSSVGEVVNHWVLAGSCIMLMVTGYAFLFHVEGISSLFGGLESMKNIHNWGGVVFCVSLLISMVHYLKDAFEYDADDLQWFKVAGGYLSHKVKVPPMGKYNPGQKLYYLGIVGAGIAIALSGFAIWLLKDNTTLMLISHLVHNVAFIVFIIAVPVHIYLSTLANPGTFQIMVNGMLPLSDAKKKYPKWIKAVGKM
jgi:formate dehydrogenase subunit gamma